ncbi:hypothetical protein CJD44_21265 [Streptomyces sp. alain-838]|nr:hypothetical protein CJD44_21265 [Streptomyces sp. alain-838]
MPRPGPFARRRVRRGGPDERRARRTAHLYGAIVNTGVGWGLLLANLMFLALAQLPDGAFRSWGWRVPFLLSAVLVALGLFIRMKVDESPDFAKVKRSGEVAKAPLVQVLRHHSGLVALMCLAYVATGAVFYIGTVFSLGYGTDHLGVDKSAMLGAVMAATALTLVAIPLFGRWSDRSERFRKGLFLAGVAGMVVLPFPWFALLDTGSYPLMLVGFALLFTAWSATYAAMPTFFARVFPVEVRYTGLSAGYTLGTVLGGGFAPMIATYLLDRTGHWSTIALYLSLAGVVSFVAACFLRERAEQPIVDGPSRPVEAMS